MASNFFSNLFGQRAGSDEPPASVLAEWNKYAGDDQGASSSDTLASRMEEGGATVQNFLVSTFSHVSTGVQGVGQSVGSGIQSAQSTLPSTTHFTWFLALLASGIVFLILAFSLFLPVIILAPSKFAICFTIGSALIMGAFVSLRGWKSQLLHMFSSDRLPFTIGYIGSMAGTLYAALALHSYILSLVCCCLQVVALLYYTVSYFPGGTNGAKFVLKMAVGAFAQCLGGPQDPATPPQPSLSQLTSNLTEATNAERGDRRKTLERRSRDLHSQPSDIPAPTGGPFPGEVSDLEDYQDPGSSSDFATPSSPGGTSDFADCQSEANSLTSSQEDEMEEGVKKLTSHGSEILSASPWAHKLEEEQKKRKAAEEAAMNLRKEQAHLEMELQLLKQQARAHVTAINADAPHNAREESMETIVARTVAAIFARVVAADEVAQQWQGEVDLLQKRMARMARMEEAIERQRLRERAARDTVQRRLLHGALAVGCIGAGALATYMAVRWLQSPARSAQLDLAVLPRVLSESALSEIDSHGPQEPRQAVPLAAPVGAHPLPDVSRSYVSTADVPSPGMMSTAEILQQADSLQAKPEGAAGAHLSGMSQSSVMGAASVKEHSFGLCSLAASFSALSLKQIVPLLMADNVHSLCLHCNEISKIECLSHLQALRDLNLSANAITDIEGLQNLRSLTSLNLASNRIQGGQLHRLDLRDNLISSLQELAVLAGLPNLRELLLAGGSPGNSICAIPSYRVAAAAALPQVEFLDGQPLEAECSSQPTMPAAAAAQHMASLQLQAFQPPQPAPTVLSTLPYSAEPTLEHFAPHAQQGLPIVVHQLAPAQDAAESIADRLMQRLAQSGAVQSLWGDQMPANGHDSAARDSRTAALEARLAALLDDRLRPPLEPIDDRGHAANGGPEAPRRKRAAPEKQSRGPVHQSGTQTRENLPEIEKLQREVLVLRGDLQRSAAELQQKTRETEEQRVEAEKVLQAAHVECKAKIVELKQQANKALKQMQHEMIEVEQGRNELQRQVKAASDREQTAVLRALQAEARVTALEADLLQATGASVHAAAEEVAGLRKRLQEAELAWLRERQQLSDELVKSKEAMQSAQQHVEHLQGECTISAAQVSARMAAAVDQARQQAAEADRRAEECCKKLQAAAAEREELQRLERQAMRRAQDLSDSLLESHAQIKTLEEACKSAEARLEGCGRDREQRLADTAAQLQAAFEAQAAAQTALAATEANFRVAVQEGKREAEVLQERASTAAAEASELRHALQTASVKLTETRAALAEVTEMTQRQKACIAALNKERAELATRSADPAQVAALRSEAAQLQERLRSFTAVKSRVAEEQKRREASDAELRRVQGELQEHRAMAEQQAADAEARLADARSAVLTVEQRATALSKDLEDARGATEIKEAMLRSANESIAQLTALLEDAQRDACTSAAAAARAEKDAAMRHSEAAARQRALRQELEVLEGAMEEARAHARSAEHRTSVLKKELEEKDEMLKYVVEEVDRVKGLFEKKEHRLIEERDDARKEAAARVAAARSEAVSAAAKVTDLEARLSTYPQQLDAAQAQAKAADEAAARQREEAARAGRRVAEVEKEMCALLNAMERQKKASVLKMQQLASVVHDLQRPFLSWAPSL
ncbi:g390 [Coccomyxa elongata]